MIKPPQSLGLSDLIVASRLQVLQSKRLLLASCERRMRLNKVESLRRHVDELHAETDHAQRAYRSALIRWGTPGRPDYWPAAYGRLIELADELADKLRFATVELAPERRFEMAVEVEVIEDLIGDWRDSLKESIAGQATA